MKIVKLAEWIVARLLTITVLALLIVRAQHAGGLWRDECASVQVAVMPTVDELLQKLSTRVFSGLFLSDPARLGRQIFGTGDAAFRCFGFAVGIILLAAIWTNSRLLAGGAPPYSLAPPGIEHHVSVLGNNHSRIRHRKCPYSSHLRPYPENSARSQSIGDYCRAYRRLAECAGAALQLGHSFRDRRRSGRLFV